MLIRLFSPIVFSAIDRCYGLGSASLGCKVWKFGCFVLAVCSWRWVGWFGNKINYYDGLTDYKNNTQNNTNNKNNHHHIDNKIKVKQNTILSVSPISLWIIPAVAPTIMSINIVLHHKLNQSSQQDRILINFRLNLIDGINLFLSVLFDELV